MVNRQLFVVLIARLDTLRQEIFVSKESGLDKMRTLDVEKMVKSLNNQSQQRFCSTGIFYLGLLYQAIAGCYTAHEDDIAPTPYVTTPVTPDLSLANAVARSLKISDISVTIVDPVSCFSIVPYNRVRLEFSKQGETQILKTIDPIRSSIKFEMRLEQGGKYRFVLKGLDGQVSEKVIIASDKEISAEFHSFCRNQTTTPSTQSE